MEFSEDTRVKVPTILHLTRLGYDYLSLKNQDWDLDTNIFPELFRTAIGRINPELEPDDIGRLLDEVKLTLDNEDLGKAFYEMLTDRSGIKLIDFETFDNNSFHVVTELTYKNGDEEFRPDIILLINGMPLVFIEVKKPNNRDGVLAERERINQRFQNPKFKKFVNITQLMIFSNNMEYDNDEIQPVQGAYYASPSYHEPVFNYFREEEVLNLTALLKPVSDETELSVLKDNNKEVIRSSPEFHTNKAPDMPTNRICTSLLSRERLKFILRYALAYVQETDGLQKHIMRYPQIFATKAIAAKLDEGVRKGIIWHTQGSGKTALAYYNVGFLTDYFQSRQIIPKFYFIVDRLDLLTQAKNEFIARGLIVHTIDSRDDFARDIKQTQVIHNDKGLSEITVVNIQKFKDDPDVASTKDYNIAIQRIYFLDEVHRSYNPRGSFLANLDLSDRNAIKIGLTGTPLLMDVEKELKKEESKAFSSKALFGDYIHKYYYNASIADGYTLRLIREEIATEYKLSLQEAFEEAKIKQGGGDKELINAHRSFAEPMLTYIINDFEKSRVTWDENTIGAMVICDSAKQARKLFEIFNAVYAETPILPAKLKQAETAIADSPPVYAERDKRKNQVKSAALILHDHGTKEERTTWVDDFKDGKIDLLIVFNMLLTGFDAKRLKKLYLGRVIRKHNLLQALTRVNRTYKDFRYGYVVDFADISKEFEETNKAYFNELQTELGDDLEYYSQLFKSQEEIRQDIEAIKDVLFRFDTDNKEIFQQQISEIQDRDTILALKKALAQARELYNIIRVQGDFEALQSLDFNQLNVLYRETSNHLALLNLKQSMEQGEDTTNLLNRALEDVVFKFTKLSEAELVLADQLKSTLRQTREALAGNFDQQDPKFITLREELERLFKKKKLSEVTQEEMTANIDALNKIHDKIKELNRANNQLRQKYEGDSKFTRIHKRLQENGGFSEPERKIHQALMGVKEDADHQVLNNTQILFNDSYFERSMMPLVIARFMQEQKFKLNAESSRYINHLVVAEYMKEFKGGAPTW